MGKNKVAEETATDETTGGLGLTEQLNHITESAIMQLSSVHRNMLEVDSLLSPTVIAARGYYTLHSGNGAVDSLQALGFSYKQARDTAHGDVLVLPIRPPDGTNGLYMIRPDVPRVFDDKDHRLPDGTFRQRVLKYEQPEKAHNRLDVNPLCKDQLGDPTIDLWVTEGIKKGDALASAGLCAVALPGGVWGFLGTNSNNASTVLSDFDAIAWKSKDGVRRRVFVVFDSDVVQKDQVKQALRRLSSILSNRGAYVVPVILRDKPDGSKQGVDDFFAAGGTVTELQFRAADAEFSHAAHAGQATSTKRLKTEDYIAILAQLGYSFRMNDMDDTIEVNGAPISDGQAAMIKMHLRDHGIDTVGIAEEAWTAYAYANRYNPIKDYLNGLQWDGEDHLGQLLWYFEDTEKTDSDPCPLFATYLKHWMIGAVAKVLDPGTHNQNAMLVLEAKQGAGKSHFARWLSGPVDKYFTESAIHPENKDHTIRLTNTWLWEVKELASTTRKADVDALKGFLTTAWITERKAWGHYDMHKPVITSFLGTVNLGSQGFLTDETGNRRFLVVSLTDINHGYAKRVDVTQLWAQARAAWASGGTWQLTKAMAIKQQELNKRYEAETDVLDWLVQRYDITRNDKDFVSIPDMTIALQDMGYRGGITWYISRDIGKALRREGLRETQRDTNAGRPKGFAGIRVRPT